MKLDLGSGHIRKRGYIRVDSDLHCDPDIYADIKDLKRFNENTIEEISTSHTLEHITKDELFKAMRGFYRILKPGCKLKITVPDSGTACHQWISGKLSGRFFERVIFGENTKSTPLMAHHQIFWDDKLHRFYTIAGFVNIKIDVDPVNFLLMGTAEKPKRRVHVKVPRSGRNR